MKEINVRTLIMVCSLIIGLSIGLLINHELKVQGRNEARVDLVESYIIDFPNGKIKQIPLLNTFTEKSTLKEGINLYMNYRIVSRTLLARELDKICSAGEDDQE